MTLRPTALVLAMAALASGCVVTPGHYESRETRYEHREYHAGDAYEGYYYVRIVYFNGAPWYVDDDLRARPVPRHLHAHFRDTSWTRSMPPRFHDHDEVRDGYRLSRVIYINDVPHHVDDGRHVRPLPSRLRNRFAYQTVARPAAIRAPQAPRGPAVVQERREPNRGRPLVTREGYGRDDDDPRHPSYRERRSEGFEDDVRGGSAYARERQPVFVREVEHDDRRGSLAERVREERLQGGPGAPRQVRVDAPPPRNLGPQRAPQTRPTDDERRGGRDDDRGQYRGPAARATQQDPRGEVYRERERETVRERDERADAGSEKRKGPRRDDDNEDDRRGGPKWNRGN
jgi:hypothetical protein